MRMGWILFLLLSMSAVFASRAQAQTDPAKELTLLFTTDLYGRFSEVNCEKTPEHNFGHLVGAIDAVRKELATAGRSAPLVFNGGDNIGPRAMARYILSEGEAGGELIAKWFVKAGYDFVALGNQDFYAILNRLRAYLQQGHKAGMTFAVANVDCAEADKGLCPYLMKERFKIFERGGLKIAVFALIHGDLTDEVTPSRLVGMQVVDPINRAVEVTAAARTAGADLVIALSHLDHSESAPKGALKLARAVPDLDLIVANAFGRAGGKRAIDTIRFADGATPIIGCDLFGDHLCRSDLQLAEKDGRWRIEDFATREMDPKEVEPNAEVHAQVTEQAEGYCRLWDKPVGKGKLAKPMDETTFRDYLMETMRHSTGSELVFVNQGLVNARAVFPLEGSISRHDFFTGLPHRNKLYTFTMKGKEIVKFCTRIMKEESLGKLRMESLGLKCTTKKTLVNGRVVDPAGKYKAVTIEYMADGMLGYLMPWKKGMQVYHPASEEDPPILGHVAREYLRRPEFASQPIDLKTNFPDLARQLRWTFNGGLSFSVSDTTISNIDSTPYTESQLARDEFVALKGELRGGVDASSTLHGFGANLRMKYARSSIAGGDWIESEDLTKLNALYKLKALRDADSGWYVPMPYVELASEVEITRPEDDPLTTEVDEDRGYHHLEVTGTLGARFRIFTPLEVKVGFGLRQEIFDDAADPVYGFDVGYKLKKTALFSLLGSPFRWESEATAFFGDTGRSNTLKGSMSNRIYFSLVGPIFFIITHDLFVYRYSDWGYGVASDLTFGLSYNAQTSIQTF